MKENNYSVEFDKILMQFAASAYENKPIPHSAKLILSENDLTTGFYAKAFIYEDKIIISIRGTDEIRDILGSDKNMAFKKIPKQFNNIFIFYNKVLDYCKKYNLKYKNIIITGHSLGGSLAQLLGYFTECYTVTFNAYGTLDILLNNKSFNAYTTNFKDNIKNYGNINDAIFYLNIDNQIGKTFVIDTNYDETYFQLFYHYLKNIGDLTYAIEYNPLLHKKYGNITLAQFLLNKTKEKSSEYINNSKSKLKNKIQHSFVFEQVLKPTFELI